MTNLCTHANVTWKTTHTGHFLLRCDDCDAVVGMGGIDARDAIEKHGRKHDDGKARWDLMPWRQLADIVDVLTHGAVKYPPGNGWKRIENAEDRYFAAMMRHLQAWRGRDYIDRSSGLTHLAHAGACILFLMWHHSNPGGGDA